MEIKSGSLMQPQNRQMMIYAVSSVLAIGAIGMYTDWFGLRKSVAKQQLDQNRRQTEYVKYGTNSGSQSNIQLNNDSTLSPERSNKKTIDLMELEELLKNDIFLLGYILKDDDGLIQFNDLDRLVRIIQKHAFLRVAQTLEQLAEQRLDYIKKYSVEMIAGPSSEYRKMVMDSINAEQEQYSKTCDRICQCFDIDNDCFVESIGRHQGEYENKMKWDNTTSVLNEKKEIWSKQYSNYNNEEKELQFEQTKDIFYFQCKLHRQTYQKLNNIRDQTLKEESQVYNHLMADQITLEYQVTATQLNQAIETHQILKDEECERELERAAMPADLQNRIIEAYNQEVQFSQNNSS